MAGDELEEEDLGRQLNRHKGETKIPPAIHDDMVGEEATSSQALIDPYGRSRRSFEELAPNSKQPSPRKAEGFDNES